jgi:hypothetical protein
MSPTEEGKTEIESGVGGVEGGGVGKKFEDEKHSVKMYTLVAKLEQYIKFDLIMYLFLQIHKNRFCCGIFRREPRLGERGGGQTRKRLRS